MHASDVKEIDLTMSLLTTAYTATSGTSVVTWKAV
jgi:hypothetical protein